MTSSEIDGRVTAANKSGAIKIRRYNSGGKGGPDVVARILLKSDDFLDALSAVRAQKAKRRSVGTTDSL